MKLYLIFAVTFTVANAVTHALSSNPNFRQYSPVTYQGQIGYPPRIGLSGRREYQETLHQESGNLYGGQREGRFLTRDNRNNLRGVQYSVRPNSDYDSYRSGDFYQQQGFRPVQESGYGSRYSGRNPQITFTAPLANTRSFNPRFDATGNRQSEYRFY